MGTQTDWPDELVALYQTQYRGYVKLAYLLLGTRAAAEEVVQEAFIAVRARWESVATSPGGYVRQAVVNGANQRRRRHEVEERLRPDPPPLDAPEDLVDLRDALARLPWAQRTAIVLRYWADLPDEETAAALGCRTGTVRSHISRGVAQLRKEVSR